MQLDFLERAKSNEWKNLVGAYLKNEKEHFNENSLQLSMLMAEKENKDFKQLASHPAKIQDLMYIKGIFADGGKIPVYIPEKYISKINIALFWGVLMIGLGLIVGVIYYKRDFK